MEMMMRRVLVRKGSSASVEGEGVVSEEVVDVWDEIVVGADFDGKAAVVCVEEDVDEGVEEGVRFASAFDSTFGWSLDSSFVSAFVSTTTTRSASFSAVPVRSGRIMHWSTIIPHLYNPLAPRTSTPRTQITHHLRPATKPHPTGNLTHPLHTRHTLLLLSPQYPRPRARPQQPHHKISNNLHPKERRCNTSQVGIKRKPKTNRRSETKKPGSVVDR